MQDRAATKPNRYAVYDDSHNFLRYEYHERADEPTQAGDPLNKNTLLKDTTATLLGLPSTALPDDALKKLQSLDLKIQYGYSAYTYPTTTVALSDFTSFVQVSLTISDPGAPGTNPPVLQNISTSSFRWACASGIKGVYWMAIGR